MGKLRNFNKIKFHPFQSRIGDLQVRNFWMDEGTPKTLQSHLKLPKFSFFEIVKFEKNGLFGKLQEYIDNGYEESFSGDFLQKDGRSIQKSFFDREESCFTLASWNNMDHDEKIPNLSFCNNRPFELAQEDQIIFMQLAKIAQDHIEKILNDHDDEEEY